MGSTIVAGNSGSSGPDIYGTVASQGFNLIGNTSGSSGYVASDQLIIPLPRIIEIKSQNK